ncbi:hypothetical protein [Actinokineospora inagensis]|uniref:hypothetical protein n=1 Tax=Actinokineospora inagensis TaxID=103730 RepID=UPI0012FAD0C6|nr:hypothetical protein [Actinokineospora inagensis]
MRSLDPVILPATPRDPRAAVWCVVLYRGSDRPGRHRAVHTRRTPWRALAFTVLVAALAVVAWLVAEQSTPAWLARSGQSLGGLVAAIALFAPVLRRDTGPAPAGLPAGSVAPQPIAQAPARTPDRRNTAGQAWSWSARPVGLPRPRRVMPAASNVSRTLA